MTPAGVSRGIVALLFVVVSVTASALAVAWKPDTAAALPYYGSADLTPVWSGTSHRVGAFTLVTQTGAALTNADLAGRVHVASFVYTRCSALCPRLVRSLARLQDRIRDPRFVLVSFSVTPDLDTPSVLSAFGRARGIDPARWKLVTGDKRVIYTLARESYFASDERLLATLEGPDAFLHTEQFVLVDRTGRLRGVYNGTQAFDVEHLIEDALRLLAS
jgi:protein SCO1/2